MSPNEALQQARIEHQWHIFVALLKGAPLPLAHVVPARWPIMMLPYKKPKPHRTPAAPLASQEVA